jgi:hypothetical protein
MKKVLAIFFALLLMTSHSGVVFATHYCMGEIADVQIGFETHADPCEMAANPKSCELDSEAMNKMDCCSDDYVQIQLNESYQTLASDAPIHMPFLIAFTYSYFNIYGVEVDQNPEFSEYSPPILQQDIPVLFQSFLI